MFISKISQKKKKTYKPDDLFSHTIYLELDVVHFSAGFEEILQRSVELNRISRCVEPLNTDPNLALLVIKQGLHTLNELIRIPVQSTVIIGGQKQHIQNNVTELI